jgi:hypothetical protein
VPAQQLWDPPRPNDLITVPACGPCNNGTQQDDDYFRATLALVAEPTPSEALESIRPTAGDAHPTNRGREDMPHATCAALEGWATAAEAIRLGARHPRAVGKP